MEERAGDDQPTAVQPVLPVEPPVWVLEQERAIHRLRVRVHELETTAEVERDAVAPYGIASAGVFTLLVSLTLPWLVGVETGEAVSGWALLAAPTAAPLPAVAALLVLLAVIAQTCGLVLRPRGAALVATAATTVAGLGATTVVFSLARHQRLDAGTGVILSLLMLLVVGIAWAGITEGRRWTA